MTRSVLGPAWLRFAGVLGFAAAIGAFGVVARAHGGHEGVEPVVKQITVGAEPWQVGVGVVPPDPFAGETLHIEVKAEPRHAGADPTGPATAPDLRLRVDDAVVPLQASNIKGVLEGQYRVDDAGDHVVAVELTRGARATTEFPLLVRSGSIDRIRHALMALFGVLLAGAGALLAWNATWRATIFSAPYRGRALAAVVAVAVLIGVALGPFSTAVARRFVPPREEQSVDWIPDEPAAEHLHSAALGEPATTPNEPAPH